MKKQYLIMITLVFGIGLFFAGNTNAQWVEGAGVIWTNDNVGIGITGPEKSLEIDGDMSLGTAGSIFSKRQAGQFHNFFAMDANDDIIINRSSIVDGLPSHMLMFVGEGRTFQVKSSTNQTLLRVNESNGRVGIRTAGNPGRELEVNGDVLLGINGKLYIRRQDGVQHEVFSMDNNNDILVNRASIVQGLSSNIYFGLGPANVFDVRGTGNKVLMRVKEDTGNMYLDGKITAKEIEVKLDIWPDYVFADDYNLMSLSEVESYIHQNRHLPGVPSEEDVLENGVSLGQMSAILLKKVEELTLHMIELGRQNEELRQKISELEK